jgi:glycerol-3-phosphate dehydrogenase
MRTIRYITSIIIGIAAVIGAIVGAVLAIASGLIDAYNGITDDPASLATVAWGVVQVLGYGLFAGIIFWGGMGLAAIVFPGEQRRSSTGRNRPIGQTVPWMDRHGNQRPL